MVSTLAPTSFLPLSMIGKSTTTPSLIFDVLKDPAERYPLDPEEHFDLIRHALRLMSEHNKASVERSNRPLRWQEIQSTCLRKFESGCRTKPQPLELDSKDGAGNSNSIDQAEERVDTYTISSKGKESQTYVLRLRRTRRNRLR
eukprot:scaffold11213_cov202-Skeletonema_dohrnii-CCMP3373.AAC.2